MFKKYWLESISDALADRRLQGVQTPEDFDSTVEITVRDAILKALRRERGQLTEEQQVEVISDSISWKASTAHYRRMYGMYSKLIDKRRQEVKADFLERCRYLLFRVLTAIGIATVIFVTAILAHEMQIPLPLLMRGAG